MARRTGAFYEFPELNNLFVSGYDSVDAKAIVSSMEA